MGKPFSMGQKTHRPCGQPRGELITPITFTPETLRTLLICSCSEKRVFTSGGSALRISELRGIQSNPCFRQKSSLTRLRHSWSLTPSSTTRAASSVSECSRETHSLWAHIREAPTSQECGYSRARLVIACSRLHICRVCYCREGLRFHSWRSESYRDTRSRPQV